MAFPCHSGIFVGVLLVQLMGEHSCRGDSMGVVSGVTKRETTDLLGHCEGISF